MRRSARRWLLRAASSLGASALVARSAWRRRRLVILCYHGISLADEHEWDPELYMPPSVFRERMRRLRDGGYHVLPLGEAIARLAADELPPRSVAVTFDDGSYDFFAAALPVLREFGIPATNYVTTFYSDLARPVFDPACAYMLWKGRARRALALPDVTPTPLPLDTRAERDHAWRVLSAHARRERWSAVDKDRLLGRVAEALGIDYERFVASRMLQQMGARELRALPPELVDVQLHTHRHRMPPERDLFERELHDNREHLAALLGTDAPRVHFCYPSGAYEAQHLRWLTELGVRTATTSHAHIATASDHPLLLPRYTDTLVQPPGAFDAWVSGLYPALLRRPRGRWPKDPEGDGGTPSAVRATLERTSAVAPAMWALLTAMVDAR